jgi:hypothetical protein
METENIKPYAIILKFRITFEFYLHQFKIYTKMIKKITNLLTIITLLGIYSCSKTIDVIPNQNVIGTWKFQSASGSATAGSKSFDLKEDLAVSSGGNTVRVKKVTTWTFKDGGTGTNDGVPLTYAISGNKLSVTQNGILFSINVSVDNNQMTVNEDETGLKSLLDAVNNFIPDSKITKYNRTLIYRSLNDILATNGTPECVTKGYTISSGNGKTVTKDVYTFTYNDENKVIEYSYPRTANSQVVTSKYTFEEYKENLGSDTKPYIVESRDKLLNAKYYCDKNGRVNRTEYFSSGSNTFPSFTEYEEYDSNGNHIKQTFKGQNTSDGSFTGDFYVVEGVYEGGNILKFYYSDTFGKTVTKRYLYLEYKPSSTQNKNTISYLYNYGTNDFGEGNKNLPDKRIRYNEDGSISRQGTFVYKLDSKGFLTSSDISYSDGTSVGFSGYTYQCK